MIPDRLAEPGRPRDTGPACRGLLLGTAVGDALGLPMEGLSPRRARRLFPGPPRHRVVFGRGMVSDDTEHAIFTAQALLAHPDSPSRFARSLAWKLRFWFLGLPAGIGWATLRAIVRLWCGVPPDRSGVWSAGNGPAMRSAVIGAYFAGDPEKMDAFVAASTRLTHTDPRALTGAKAVAALAGWAVQHGSPSRSDVEDVVSILSRVGTGEDREWREIVSRIRSAYEGGLSVAQFADQMGLRDGVTGYIYHSVPVAIYAWLVHGGDVERTVVSALECGGDTDTVGAIAGALAGAAGGEASIPNAWVDGIWDWPRGPWLLREIGARLAEPGGSTGPVRYGWPALVVRNVVFFIMVLAHGLRRLAPPY